MKKKAHLVFWFSLAIIVFVVLHHYYNTSSISDSYEVYDMEHKPQGVYHKTEDTQAYLRQLTSMIGLHPENPQLYAE